MTGNTPYLPLITWVSLTSIKEMEHSRCIQGGRMELLQLSGMPGGGRAFRPSESIVFSVSK